jgi:nitroimidazol reductase NimA-like FMN-containing flavoprotein (pyridoxamine 5'-phosphate oxidase superfamily)
MNGELNEQQINNILTSQLIGRLACCLDKYPYIVPVTFAFDGIYIYGQSFEGKKLELLRKNPNVCFEVDIANDISNWQSAVIYGQFEELEKEDAEEARILLFNKAMPLMTKSSIHMHEHDEGEGHELSDKRRVKPIMFRIKINEKSGRFERQ